MAAVSYHCPNCGGELRFDPNIQRYQCDYCGSDFEIEEKKRRRRRRKNGIFLAPDRPRGQNLKGRSIPVLPVAQRL